MMRDIWLIFFLSSFLAFFVPGALWLAAVSGALVGLHLLALFAALLFPRH